MGTAEKHFGLQIKKARAVRGISQEELADLAEIHCSYVSQLERGRKSPSLGVIMRISKALGMPASQLIKHVEEALTA